MTTNTTATPSPGDEIHWVRSGILWASSLSFSAPHAVSQRGQTIELTAEIIEASFDRNGANSWLGLTDKQQISRWGSVVYQPGIAPDGLTFYEPHTTEADVAHDAARTAAWAVADPERRAEALRALRAEFGHMATSTTVRTERGTY